MSDDLQYEEACRAADQEQEVYGAVGVRYDEAGDAILIQLARGISLSVPRQLLQGLDKATPDDLRSIEVDPSGIGLHIESLDWDMSIPGIMQGRYGSARWMQSIAGKSFGVVRSGPSFGGPVGAEFW